MAYIKQYIHPWADRTVDRNNLQKLIYKLSEIVDAQLVSNT